MEDLKYHIYSSIPTEKNKVVAHSVPPEKLEDIYDPNIHELEPIEIDKYDLDASY